MANWKTKSIQEKYAQIGGGSESEKWTKLQGEKMVELLDVKSKETGPHKYYIGFRYNEPMTKTALEEMMRDGITNAVAFPQYPQYSCATSGSSLNDLYRHQKSIDPNQSIKWSFIDRWATHPLLVKVFADNIQKALEKVDPEHKDTAPILFSAHSLPIKIILKGDPYTTEIGATVGYVADELRRRGVKNPYRLVWQSKDGPLEWMGPSAEHVLKTINKNTPTPSVVLIPIAFTSDHIETLYELGIECKEYANKSGISNFIVAEPPNDNPSFIECMADLVIKSLDTKKPTYLNNNQVYMRCPGCEFDHCKTTKDWIHNF
ncbi:hypothetical protein BB558_002690 [Smittium angustum]|uniref:Ferrochelatase n=1 Tax=Smittium angustum TaxID=133377 RepID=A0A2U1J7X5_SMIAN|nr:hypothetical protein BB558_002690 [Smittium angustum]